MIVSFAPSLPLYFLASDFGRWFFMSWTTLTLLLASPGLVQSFQDALSPCLKALNWLDGKRPAIKRNNANMLMAAMTPLLFLRCYDVPPRLLMPRETLDNRPRPSENGVLIGGEDWGDGRQAARLL
jgi:hypothetical protein